MDLSVETLGHVARLARLPLDEAELARLQRDVANVLTLFEDLHEVASEQPEALPGATRDDAPSRWPDREALLANAPRKDEDGRLRVGRWGP